VQAIFEAAVQCTQAGQVVRPEIMVPLVGTLAELRNQEELVRRVADQVREGAGWVYPAKRLQAGGM
jgi:pyruvate,orthophosphate dikinase